VQKIPRLTFHQRLILFYALAVSVSLLLASLGVHRLTEARFARLVADAIDERRRDILRVIGGLYDPLLDRFDPATVETLGMYFVHEGYIVTLRDSRGEVVWDARGCDMAECNRVINEIRARMARHGRFSGDVREMSVPVAYLGREVGTVRIETYGPLFFSQGESVFLLSLNRLFLAVFIAFGAVSALVSVILASCVLHEADKRQRRLTVDVAHELRTPLTCLQGTVEALIDGVWEPTKERLESCGEEIGRLSKLVADLSLLTDIEWETIKLEKRDFDLARLLESTAASFAGLAARKGIRIRLDLEPRMVHADYDRIKQVFINLLSNAFKYTERGEVTVRCRGREAAVADTGCGMDAEACRRVFERFYRADRSRSRATGGAGVGLTIAQALMKAHGGVIKVESEPGRGSIFHVFF